MATLQPELKELQEKYKGNKERLQQETMELYRREKHNPTAGCLPLVVQMPILFGMISVIYRPLTHLLRLPQSTITLAQELLTRVDIERTFRGFDIQLATISAVNENPGAFYAIGTNALNAIQNLEMTFFGMDLTLQPSLDMIFGGNWNPVVLIPILSGVSALAVSLLMTRYSAMNAAAPGGAGSMKMMMYVMPVFSVMFAFSVAAGVGLYWMYTNIVSIGRTLLMNKIYNPAEMAKKAKEDHERRKEEEREQRAKEKAEARQRIKDGKATDEDNEKSMSAKEIARRKLAEARKRDAEKYGEEYVEVTDEDLR